MGLASKKYDKDAVACVGVRGDNVTLLENVNWMGWPARGAVRFPIVSGFLEVRNGYGFHTQTVNSY